MTATPCDVAAAIDQQFAVRFDYPVRFVRDAFDPGNPVLAQTIDRRQEGRRHRVAVYVDQGLLEAQPQLSERIGAYFHAHRDLLELAGDVHTLPGGPAVKRGYAHLGQVLTTLGNLHLDRQSVVLGVGGGSMLDALGLVVSLLHRGLRLVRMPSTVLAQDDAGIGVKNGIDEHGQKNFLGTFAPPFAVINDLSLLRTLSDTHWRGGVAEAFKVALIRDAAFFEYLESHAEAVVARDETVMAEIVRRCAVIHLHHIATSGDPFEMGSARPLDFGHWAAHRLEVLSGGEIAHGQAVSIGIAVDVCYAVHKGLLSEAERDRILTTLERCGLPVYAPALSWCRADGEYEILQGLRDFQEHLGGRLNVTLPDGIGDNVELHHMNAEWVVESIELLRARGEGR